MMSFDGGTTWDTQFGSKKHVYIILNPYATYLCCGGLYNVKWKWKHACQMKLFD